MGGLYFFVSPLVFSSCRCGYHCLLLTIMQTDKQTCSTAMCVRVDSLFIWNAPLVIRVRSPCCRVSLRSQQSVLLLRLVFHSPSFSLPQVNLFRLKSILTHSGKTEMSSSWILVFGLYVYYAGGVVSPHSHNDAMLLAPGVLRPEMPGRISVVPACLLGSLCFMRWSQRNSSSNNSSNNNNSKVTDSHECMRTWQYLPLVCLRGWMRV